MELEQIQKNVNLIVTRLNAIPTRRPIKKDLAAVASDVSTIIKRAQAMQAKEQRVQRFCNALISGTNSTIFADGEIFPPLDEHGAIQTRQQHISCYS